MLLDVLHLLFGAGDVPERPTGESVSILESDIPLLQSCRFLSNLPGASFLSCSSCVRHTEGLLMPMASGELEGGAFLTGVPGVSVRKMSLIWRTS